MNPDFQEIRKLIERRFRRRALFGLHFIAFAATVIVTTWWMYSHPVYPGDWQNLWYLAGWAVIFLGHWLFYRLANTRDQEIEAAWERSYGSTMLDAEESEQKFKPTSNRLRLFENDEVQDEWVEEKPKRTLHED
jgi:hypothetical protein